VVAHQGAQRAGYGITVRFVECTGVEAAKAVQDQVVLGLGQVGQPGDQVRPMRAGQPGTLQKPAGDDFGVPGPFRHAHLRRLVVQVPLAPASLVGSLADRVGGRQQARQERPGDLWRGAASQHVDDGEAFVRRGRGLRAPGQEDLVEAAVGAVGPAPAGVKLCQAGQREGRRTSHRGAADGVRH
jgi:hypothetical protein